MIHALVVVEKNIKIAAGNKKCFTLFIMNNYGGNSLGNFFDLKNELYQNFILI